MLSGLRFLDHGGEMAARIREADWEGSPLGRPEEWPPALKFALDMALAATFPTAIYWGPDFRLLYNDAWAPIPAERHPWALGRPGGEVWADIWDVVGPQIAQVVASGEGFAIFDQYLPMERDGRPHDTWWNYSFTPIRDEDGEVVGVLNQGNETTRSVLAEQARLAEVGRLRELMQQAPGAVALLHGPEHRFDIANAAYVELVGGRDVLGQPLAEALPEVVGQGFIDLLDSVFASGEPYRATGMQIALQREAGAAPEMRLLDFVYQPIKDANGNTTDIFVEANDVTEREQAQEALRVSEERLQLALDSSIGVGTWFWDVKANQVSADARFLQLYGVREIGAGQSAPIESFFRNIHPDDLPRVQAGIARALTHGGSFHDEYRLVQPDGAISWVSAQGRCTLDEDGEAVRFPGVSFDITERKHAEDAARAAAEELRKANESQAFLFALAERLRGIASPEAVIEHSVETLIDWIGADRAGFYRVDGDALDFGASVARGALAPLSGNIPLSSAGASALASYRAGRTVILSDTAAGTDLADSDIPSRAASAIGVPLLRGGEWVATLYVNQAMPRAWSGEEVAIVEAVAELTWDAVERANAVVRLRESEEKFRAIANSIDPMVWSTLPDGYHDYYNDRWYEYTGVPPGTTDGEGWAELFHPDDQARAWKLWGHSLATGEPYYIEYRLRHRTGTYRWVLGRAQPVRDADGRITRWFGTCTDIQEIVDAREVLARSREQLEAEIRVRTQRLMQAEEQLRQAQKMEAVGQLTGGIAHDFNNMLAVVIGALDLLERRLAKGEIDVERYVIAAKDGAGRAAALTQRLLAFSRQQPLAPVPVDVNEMIDGMIELLVRTLSEDITVETQLRQGVGRALADPNQLENAILNLAVNARDAMPGGGTLVIATAAVTLADEAAGLGLEPGDYVEISVADGGVGMPPDVVARAFDPFFTTKGVGKGTGLGLSQVFGFVRQSGGTVRIDTSEGTGTDVRLYLPGYQGPAPETVEANAAGMMNARPGEVVMVVEDEERVRTFSVEALRELGYQVVDARDAREALRLIERGQQVSLLFTDVVMPEINGRELAKRAQAMLPELKVLLTSGYTPEVAGDDQSILTKPFDLRQLAARVRAALDG
ncbi:PAS domain-containing protein [Sphingomonas sp. M1-B02]|uniref:PAS domain-containing protein n=1 Tax=Sphingomonas sp. M1-B02 TaxID=3114300 RepID=UPI0022400DCC|nr:PAS domain-containing protein [Sphingomonas sp. S6-11]UZK65380.1 PAS domain-containing protein [Sphingomonas sp. S6-11]